MKFKYRAKNLSGKEETGEVDATSQELASGLLSKKQLFVIDIKPASKGVGLTIFRKKVPLKDKIIFTEQLAIMIRSGLNIVEALKSLAEETSSKELSRSLEKIINDVESGRSFSDALAKFPHIFDTVYVSIVASGEQSGKLDEVLIRLAGQMDKSYDLIAKVRGALIYPVIVFVALIGVGIFVLAFILPKLKNIFLDSGVQMPLITKIIMGMGDALVNYWYWFLIGLIILTAGIVLFGKTSSGRTTFDHLKLKIPVFGLLFKKAYMANFSRTFSSLSASGLPILNIFKVVKEGIDNSLYREEIEKMSKKVENGVLLSKVLKDSKLFPNMMSQLALVGEKSGQMDEVFNTLANFYERDVENMTKNLSALIEPIMMVFLGAGIGVLIVAVLQPIYGLVGAV